MTTFMGGLIGLAMGSLLVYSVCNYSLAKKKICEPGWAILGIILAIFNMVCCFGALLKH